MSSLGRGVPFLPRTDVWREYFVDELFDDGNGVGLRGRNQVGAEADQRSVSVCVTGKAFNLSTL